MKVQGVYSRLSTLDSRLACLTRRRALLVACAGALLASCGFHLRGAAKLPFESVYISAGENSPVGNDLTRLLRGGSNVRIADRAEDAQAVLHILSELREKQILTLTRAGTVAEFVLRYRVSFRVTGQGNRELVPTSEIVLQRDYSFNSSQVLAKEQEEVLLYRDMQGDAVQQIVRRLEAVRL